MAAVESTDTVLSSCHEKTRLTSNYKVYTDQYNRQVRNLFQRSGVISKSAYDELRRSTEEARILSEKARIALEAHIVKHGC